MGDYHGTLAAARDLGRAGRPVLLVDRSGLSRTRWSRYVRRRIACPAPGADPQGFLEVLLAFGQRESGHVLYPTSDDTAFLFALHADRLGRWFRLYQPPLETVYALLNKKRLFRLCSQVGLDAPATWFPTSEEEVAALVEREGGPVLVKPQTQIQFVSQIKGFEAANAADAVRLFRAFVAQAGYGEDVRRYDPEVVYPMLQAYHGEAVRSVYSLAGFIDRRGAFAVRASNKVFQRPRRLGVGVCFEAAPPRDDLVRKVIELCGRVGYYGAFEVEFIQVGERYLLIDFNPRFYGQMGFEIARGLPQAQLVYEAALGNDVFVSKTLAMACEAESGPRVYRHQLVLSLALTLSRLSGAMSRDEHRGWKAWLAARGDAVDAMYAPDDRLPAFVDALVELLRAFRHPRSFFRSLASS